MLKNVLKIKSSDIKLLREKYAFHNVLKNNLLFMKPSNVSVRVLILVNIKLLKTTKLFVLKIVFLTNNFQLLLMMLKDVLQNVRRNTILIIIKKNVLKNSKFKKFQ